jgi:SAP domain.
MDDKTRDAILEELVYGRAGSAQALFEEAQAAEEEEEDESESDSEWDAYTVTELKGELESRDLETSGRKSELIARLEADDNAIPETVV